MDGLSEAEAAGCWLLLMPLHHYCCTVAASVGGRCIGDRIRADGSECVRAGNVAIGPGPIVCESDVVSGQLR
jgi:hypothetical protein